MYHVGEALGDTLTQARNNIVSIGIAPWGVVHKRNDLIGKDVNMCAFCNAFDIITKKLIPKGCLVY